MFKFGHVRSTCPKAGVSEIALLRIMVFGCFVVAAAVVVVVAAAVVNAAVASGRKFR